MKQKKLLRPLLLGLLLLVTACTNINASSDSNPNPSSNNTTTQTTETTESSNSGGKPNSRPGSESSEEDVSSSSSSSSSSETGNIEYDGYYKAMNHLYNNREVSETNGEVPLRSVGDQKLLVVPVYFTDTPSSLKTATYKNAIYNTFFGKSSDTGWESVASYYEKSSFGRLRITGEVTDFFNLNISTSALEGKTQYADPVYYVLEQIYKSFNATKLREYDLDEDGHVDAIWLVYMHPHQEGDDTSFWAYQWFYDDIPSPTKPTFNCFAWASYDFMLEGEGYSLSNPDAHTFIHETGHVLSLYDYYDYTGESSPAGSIDMMDFNVIDHNSYSKYVLNWVEPYVVTDDATIRLNSTTETGNFILINDKWNGHAYDEYIVIEFYTPTGLNEKDIDSSYENAYSTKGVRMYHIDSRLMSVRSSGRNDITAFVDAIVSNSNTYTAIGISNTQNSTWHIEGNYNHKHVHLLNPLGTATGRDWYNSNIGTTNSALFQTGNKISANNWKKYLKYSNDFNDGGVIGYDVEIGTMTNTGVEIIITKA